MKVLFLDIDGVLNRIGGNYAGLEHPLDPEAIERLNRVAEATGAVAVLTSSWRLMLPWPACRDALTRNGMRMEIVGETQDLWRADEDLDQARRREIEDWLARHEVERWVAVDDQPVFPDVHPRFVRTEETLGLTDRDVERLLERLAR